MVLSSLPDEIRAVGEESPESTNEREGLKLDFLVACRADQGYGVCTKYGSGGTITPDFSALFSEQFASLKEV